MDDIDRHQVAALITYLATRPGGEIEERWRDWQLRSVVGGRNGRVFRVARGATVLAVKFCRRDERDRAGREFAALQTLQAHGLAVAPAPVWLDRAQQPHPVVVQRWLEGHVATAPPATDAEWACLVEHYATLTRVRPATTSVPLARVVLTASSAAEARGAVAAQVDQLSPTERPRALSALLERLDRRAWPTWPAPALTLGRGDAQTRNFIRRAGPWASVDWEYSGWGDPAFELAELIAHVAYLTVPAPRWPWVIARYGQLVGDATIGQRAAVYLPHLLVWWVARLARARVEWARGQDARLAERPPTWAAELATTYDQCLARAQAHLDRRTQPTDTLGSA